MPRPRSNATPSSAIALAEEEAPKGRNIPAQGNALGASNPEDSIPVRAAELLNDLLKLREAVFNGRGKYKQPVPPETEGLPSLPPDWIWASPDQLSSGERYALSIGPFGSNMKVEDYRDSGVPLVFVRHIRSEDYDLKAKFVSPEKAEELEAHSVEAGDLLITKMGEPPGDSSIYPEHRPKAIISADCIKWRLSTRLDAPKFFMYAMRTRVVKEQIASRTQGVAQKKVSLERFKSIALPLPPLPEQRRIVARIEELFSRLDAGVAALRHAKAQLQRYRQSVLAAAVTGQLTQAWREQHPDTEPADELLKRILKQRCEQWSGRGKYNEPHDIDGEIPFKAPGSWSWTSSEAVCASVRDGTHDTPKYVDEGVPLITSKNLLSSGLSFENTKNISQVDHAEISKRSGVADGDILFAMIGTIGNPIVVRTSAQFSIKNVALFKSNESFVSSEYLRVWLRSPIFMRWLEPKQKGTTQKFVPLGLLRSLATPLPPLAEQHQIVAEVEARTTAIDHLEAELDRQITRSNRLRQAILASAFKGTLNEASHEIRTL